MGKDNIVVPFPFIYMSTKKIIPVSTTKWETSDFGGYKAMIHDHPYVNVDLDIEYVIPNNTELNYMTTKKLLDIFLLAVKKSGFIVALCKDPSIKKIVKGFGFFTKSIIVAEVSAASKEHVINSLSSAKNEYSSLFRYYKKILQDASIYVEIKEESKENLSSSTGKGSKPKKTEEQQEGKASGSENSNKQESSSHSKKEKKLTAPQIKKLTSLAAKELSELFNKIHKMEKWEAPDIKTNFNRKPTWHTITSERSSEIVFSKKVVKWAGQLSKLLDINFDPYEDRLNSLRSGKIDQRKIGEILPGNLNVYYKIEPNQSTRPFKVVILVDESGSMSGKMELTKEMVKMLYLSFTELMSPDRLAIYGHSGNYGPTIYKYKSFYDNDFGKVANIMQYRSNNYDGPVIDELYKKIREMTNDNILFIVISDGQPNGYGYGGSDDIKDMKRIIERCRRDGFVTVGLGIEYFSNNIYDYNCVIKDLDRDMIKKTSNIINKAVKTEFQ